MTLLWLVRISAWWIIARKSQSEGLSKYQEPAQPKEPVKPKHKAKLNRARFKSKAHKKKFPGNKVGTNRVEDASSMGVDIDNQVGIMHWLKNWLAAIIFNSRADKNPLPELDFLSYLPW